MGKSMTGNAELLASIRERALVVRMAVGIEDVAYDGGWGSALAASAADVPLLLDALEVAEAERDAALAVIAIEQSLAQRASGRGE